MKKWIALLLTVAMLIGMMSAALAYDDEITFQGIPWGITLKDYDAVLRDNKIAFCSFGVTMSSTKGWILAENDNKIAFNRKNAGESPIFGFDSGSIQTEIGGYNSGGVQVHCIFDGGSWKVHAISVKFNVNNEEEAYNDLVQKLESVYGEKTMGEDAGYEYCFWCGANNTCLVLTSPTWMPITQNEFPYVTLYYGTTGAEELFTSAVDSYQLPSNNTENSTNGL